jgi:hypothetical protein
MREENRKQESEFRICGAERNNPTTNRPRRRRLFSECLGGFEEGMQPLRGSLVPVSTETADDENDDDDEDDWKSQTLPQSVKSVQSVV